ncbi:hypothetical protein MASR2M8_19120 [Opitutaceae bacterium]
MANPSLPPEEDPVAITNARRKVMLSAAIGFLILSAVVILVLPLRLPLPVRLGVVFTDLLAAAIIGLLLRQNRRR